MHRILLVDDEQVVLNVVSMMLELEGYLVEARGDGVAALLTFNADPTGFDLVITDHLMNGLSGLQLAEKIFQVRPEILIILLTGGDPRVESDAKATGIHSIIRKPVAMEPLLEMVKRAFKE
jgi:DNA-binding NtrC family response regulator